MQIGREIYATCSWCKTLKDHEILLVWTWINSADEMKSPMMCGECFETDWVRPKARHTSARMVANEWTHIERKFNEKLTRERSGP